MMEILRTPAKEVFALPEFPVLCDAYFKESGVSLWERCELDEADYDKLPFVTVWEDGKLVGFSYVRPARHTHHVSKTMASLDCVYISPEHRKGAAGLWLLDETKKLAKDIGAGTLILTAPYGSRLARLLRLLTGREPESETFVLPVETGSATE